MRKNSLFYPRVLYILAALAWYLLLWPNPITVFMAGCTACLTLPIYRKLRTIARQRRRNVEPRCRALLAKEIGGPRLLRPIVRRWRRIRTGTRLSIIRGMPMTAYLSLIIMGMILPVTLFTVLVAPQVGAGFPVCMNYGPTIFSCPRSGHSSLTNVSPTYTACLS